MKTFGKRLFSILLLTLLMTGLVYQFANAESIPDISNEYFVQDNANVMSDNEINALSGKARKFYNEYNNIRIMVVTITKLDDESIENAAIRIAKENGMDIEGRDILILLSVEDKVIHVLLGEQIKVYISVKEVNTLINTYGISEFKSEEYNHGLISLQHVLITKVKKSIQPGIEKNEISTTVTFTQNEANDDSAASFAFFIFALIVVFCIFAVAFASASA